MVRIKKAVSLFAVVAMLCSMLVAAPAYVSAEGVALELVVNPVVLLPDKINSLTEGDRTITVDVKSGVTRPWNSGDALTVEVIKAGDSYSITPESVDQIGEAITVVLPQTDITNISGINQTGWYTVNVKREGVVIGTGSMEINNIAVDGIESKEGEARIRLNGTGLASFVGPTLYAEVYQNGTKVATSRQTDFIWGSPEFQFDNEFDLSTPYTLKLFDQSGQLGASLLDGKTFTIAPALTCTVNGGAPIISGSTADTLTILDRSTLWAENQDLRIQIGGPNGGYEVTGATVADDNIQFTISSADNHMFPWQEGTYDARIMDQYGVLLGFALFYVGTPSDILKGEVRNSSGNLVPSCGHVNLSKIEDDGNVSWERWVMVLPDGKFYLQDDYLGTGNYRAQIAAPDGLAEADAFASFTTTDGVVPEEALILQFRVPNISGRVKLPDGTDCSKSVVVAVFNGSDTKTEAYQIWTKSDGTFNICVDNAGKYYLKGRPHSDLGVAASKLVEVNFDGATPLTDIAVQYQNPQIVLTAKSPSGSALTTDNYWVWVEPVDHQNGEYELVKRENDYLIGNMAPGQYRVGAFPEGNCPYAKSLGQTVTVTEESPAAPITLDEALTNVKLTGKITNMIGWSGGVAVYRKTLNGFENKGSFPVVDGGNYRIGGVENGDYYVRAELYYESPLKSTYGASVMTPVTISDSLTSLDLTLGDTSPRVVYVSEMQNGSGKARMRVVNIDNITKNLDGKESLRAEIVNLDGSSLSPKLELSGADCFNIRWDCLNVSADEGDIEIFVPEGINLPLGTYKLNLYDIKNATDPADDVLIVPEISESNIFDVTASVGLSKYGFFPSRAGQNTIVESFEQTPLWASGDVLEVAFVSDSDVSSPAVSVTIQADNKLDITVPSLTAGNYYMIIKKAGKLLVKQHIEVATPKINSISGASDADTHIKLSCENTSALMGDDTIIKIYSGANLMQTVQHKWNMWGDLMAEFNEPLPVGDYTVKVWVGAETDENLMPVPNGGALKVVKCVKPSKSFVMEGYANGTTQTMSAANGSVPWNAGEDLTLGLVNGTEPTNGVVEIALSDDAAVTADGLTFQLPDDVKLSKGSWDVMVYNATGLIAKGKFDIINSSDIAFSGTVTGVEGGIATGAKIKMESLDRKYFQEFYTDANGSYAAYWINNPGTYNVWVEPKETEPFMKSEPRELTIDASGHCSTQTQNFTLDAARFINGTVSLPSGTAAKDMEFWIFGFSENGTPNDETDDMMGGYGGKIITGSSSATYALKVPKAAASGFYLQLYINTNEYIGSYYYGSGGEKYSISEATAVDVSSGDQSGKDITLAVGKTIEGTLTIPAEVAIPAEGYEMKLFALIDNNTVDKHDDWFVSGSVKLTASTQAYTLHVPANLGGLPYKVAYDADPKGILELQGFYKASGTVYDKGLTADTVDVSASNATNIDLTARIRTDVETRAGFLEALVTAIGSEKFIQPTESDITTYGTTYTDWAAMTANQKTAMAIAVKNGIVKGTQDNKICSNEFLGRAASMVILARTSYVFGANLAETQPDINFPDISGHWAEDAILYIARAGIVNGYDDGNFDPDGFLMNMQTSALLANYAARLATANATRAGFISKIIYGLGTTRFTQPTQEDIAGYAVQFADGYETPLSMNNAMAIAVKNSVVFGTDDGRLRPNASITRAEASLLLCRILDQADPALTLKVLRSAPSFSDVPDGHWAKAAIDRLYRANVINGITAGTFEPDQALPNASLGTLAESLFNGINSAQAVITVPPESQTVTYGTASVTLSVTASGDNISYQWKKGGVAIDGATSSTYTINNPLPADAGSYTVEIKTGTIPLVTSVTSTAAVLTVNPKQLTVTGLTAENKTYDGTTAAVISGTAALSGIVGADVVELSGTPAAVFADKNAADGKTVNVSGYTLSGADAAKYTLAQPVLSANISKAALTATADNKQRAYGASNPAFTITYSGFVNGETVSNSGITPPSAACTATASSPGGAYEITLTGENGGTNYALTTVKGTLAVIPGLPNVTFSFDGTDANKLKGSTTAMEYSLDGGTTWVDCTADTDLTAQLGSISAVNDIKVREKAVTGPPAVPAGVVLTIDILAAPAAPSLTVNYTTEKIMSATALMEYKIDSGAYQTVTTAEAVATTGGIDLSSIIPANGSDAKALTIRVKSTGHTLSGTVQTINIPARPATPIAPTASQILPTGITLTSSVGYEYTKNDGTAWQDGNIFNGLTTGTPYSFKQRVKATTGAFASEKSPELSVTYYTVTFVPNGGSPAPEIKAVVSGGTVTAPADMTKTGYTGGTSADWYAVQDLSKAAYSFATAVTSNITLYAKWTINKYNVTATVSGGTGGVISPAAQNVAYGDNLTLTILPDVGYNLTAFTVGGIDKLSSVVNGKYLISNITADTAVSATFGKKSYAVTKNAGAGGSITANAAADYATSLTVTIVPDQGKNIGSVEYIMNGTTVRPTLDGSNQFTITSVTGSVTINATFADVDKTALKNAIINAMSINPEAYLEEYRTAFISAQSAAILVLVKADATAEEVNAAATALVSATTNMSAEHKKVFTVTVNVPFDTQGSAIVDKPNPKHGEDVTITATPEAGYTLYKILVNGVQLNGTVIKCITANTVVTVLFKSTIPQAVIDFKTGHAVALGLNITTVTSGDINANYTAINNAITAYVALTAEQQKYLAVEYQLLKALKTYLDNKTKADEVIAAITDLSVGERNLAFVRAVNSAIAKYLSLTPDQQKLVGIVKIYLLNKYKLEADVIFQKDLVDTARINHVKGLIEDLNTTIGQGGDYADIAAATIEYNAAKTAYDSLSTDLKAQITAPETNKLNGLKTVIDSANQVKASIVQDQINALTVVLSTMDFDTAEGYKKAIIEAKNAYDALTEAQKAFVSTAAKAKLTECFESVAVIIEKPVVGLDTSVSFTGISDKVSDMTVTPADASTEAAVNQKLNTDGADTARKTDMVISISLQNSSNSDVQPDGKVVMKIKINADIKNRKPKIMSLDSLNNLFEVPSWVTGSDANGWYLEFETDHFSDYAVVSAVLNTNANLSALSLDGVTLSPAFDKNTTSYTASVANSVTSTVVSPVVEDTGKATATGSGTWSLSVGANTKSIVVTAEDGTTKTYTVTVTRAAAANTPGGDTGDNTNPGITPVLPIVDPNNTVKTQEPTVTEAGKTTTASFTAGAQTDEKTGIANADIDAKTVEALTALAKKAEVGGQKAVVEIKVEPSKIANSISVDIPREAFNNIVTETDAALKVNAGLGTITFNTKAVEHLSQSNEGDMSISISKVEAASLAPEVKSKVGERPVYSFSVKAGSTEISKFGNGAAEISIPYTLKAGEKKNAIVVYYIDSNGKLITVRGRYDEAAKTVSFKTNHFSQFAIGYNEVKFNDVSASAWYNEAVGFIAARGITTGTSAGIYNPDSNLTRGQYIVMIMKAYGIEPLENPADNFADSGKTYYTNYLAAAKKLGITSGVGNNMYAPGKEITRQEMFTLLYNTLKAIGELPEGNSGKTPASFTDSDKIATWAKDAMTLFVQTGTISGSNGRLAPQETSNRAQMAQVIYNLLAK